MYDPNAASCAALLALRDAGSNVNTFYDQGWTGGLPWLYYTGDTDTIIRNAG